jgi:DNA-binding response OmpR family regulator
MDLSMDAIAKSPEPSTTESSIRRVALVEDNPDSRRTLGLILKAWGFQASQAEDGVSGLELILQEEPPVALIDIGLPGLDGLTVAREVRDKLGERIRLIAITGYGQPEDRIRSYDAGFDFHLVKPVDLDVLQTVLTSQPPTRGKEASASTEAGAVSQAACPVCGGRLIEIRGKLQCSTCRTICETCCEGGRG